MFELAFVYNEWNAWLYFQKWAVFTYTKTYIEQTNLMLDKLAGVYGYEHSDNGR